MHDSLEETMYSKSLLLIDDDVQLCQLLVEYLSPQGYRITLAHDGEQGLELASGNEHFDLILLDVMLPKMDGFDVLRRLRATHLTPVLMLTARGEDFDRIFGLEIGADDYLAKPFNHRELSARIKAIVRRMDFLPSTGQQRALQVGSIHLDPSLHEVSAGGHALAFTSTEFSILQLLMVNQGQVVGKNDISEKILHRKLSAFDRSIDMHVSNIRKKLAACVEAECIKTIRGSGYMLVTQN